MRLLAHLINQSIAKSVQFKELLAGKETIKNLWGIFRAFFLMVEIDGVHGASLPYCKYTDAGQIGMKERWKFGWHPESRNTTAEEEFFCSEIAE